MSRHRHGTDAGGRAGGSFGLVFPVAMKRRHFETLCAIFAHPLPRNLAWSAIWKMLESLGGSIRQREGSRVAVTLGDAVLVVRVNHGAGASKAEKGRLADVREWLRANGLTPDAARPEGD